MTISAPGHCIRSPARGSAARFSFHFSIFTPCHTGVYTRGHMPPGLTQQDILHNAR